MSDGKVSCSSCGELGENTNDGIKDGLEDDAHVCDNDGIVDGCTDCDVDCNIDGLIVDGSNNDDDIDGINDSDIDG